jgi:sugar lactone lactonase YvrE
MRHALLPLVGASGADKGPLWRLEGTVLVPQGNDATLSNGLAWSQDGRTMYHSDTMSGDIYAWDYEPAGGKMTRGRLFAHVDGAPGPDGAEVDSEGFYWSAINGQGRILRFDPDGRIDREIAVPFKYPTMIAFGGADLRTAFVTSGRWAIADKDAADHPLDGGIFAFDAPAPGLPTSRWAG